MINASLLESVEALFITLRITPKQPQGNQYQQRYEVLNVCIYISNGQLLICDHKC